MHLRARRFRAASIRESPWPYGPPKVLKTQWGRLLACGGLLARLAATYKASSTERWSLVVFLLCAQAFAADSVLVLGEDPGPWPAILAPLGIPVKEAAYIPPQALAKHLEAGAIAVLSGQSEYAESIGIRPTSKQIPVRNVIDTRNAKLPVIWEKQLEIPVYSVPVDAQVFVYERWTKSPLVVGVRRGKGAALWLAVHPGEKGYERFPYIPQALNDLGLVPPFRSNRLWAFFDGAYRARVDFDHFAERWKKAGISALHVAAWHYMTPDAERDAFVRRLVQACHRRAIHVYAWLELPHVSEDFWRQNPQCREKTALLQDAHLDWRKLINLENPDCHRTVSTQVRKLIERFDWDGVNLAELYYESLEGMANPARFTPMNDEVRREYKAHSGVDPLELFSPGAGKDVIARFLDFRAGLAERMQRRWLDELTAIRSKRPQLDIVLTHVDDRFDTRMRDLIGADASRVLPLLNRYDFTFLVEDPATIWHLGPARYSEIAKRYAPLTTRPEKLAIDINIVERYQDVYPTKQQTGTELFQLVHTTSAAFNRVALYFENSILKPDWEMLPSAAAVVKRYERIGPKTVVESAQGVGIKWRGTAAVDGRPWPVSDGETVWLTPGAHVLEASSEELPFRMSSFNGELTSARVLSNGVEFAYQSSARAMAVLSAAPQGLEIDGEPAVPQMFEGNVLVLPRGQHVVTIRSGAPVGQPLERSLRSRL
jgi:hypothetical protein